MGAFDTAREKERERGGGTGKEGEGQKGRAVELPHSTGTDSINVRSLGEITGPIPCHSQTLFTRCVLLSLLCVSLCCVCACVCCALFVACLRRLMIECVAQSPQAEELFGKEGKVGHEEEPRFAVLLSAWAK